MTRFLAAVTVLLALAPWADAGAAEPEGTFDKGKQAVKDGATAVGHAARDTTRAIGHASRDAARATRKAAGKAWNDVTGKAETEAKPAK